MKHAIAASLVVGVAAACGGGEQAEETNGEGAALAAACEPMGGPLMAPIDAAALAGTFDLTLVATAGPQAGEQVTGSLELLAQAEDMQTIRMAGRADTNSYMPLYGRSTVNVEAVGALNLGGIESSDPAQPGVAVLVRRAQPVSMTLRLGAEANRRDQQRFDGGYTALRATVIEDGNVYGTWASGVTSEEASGHFCAMAQER